MLIRNAITRVGDSCNFPWKLDRPRTWQNSVYVNGKQKNGIPAEKLWWELSSSFSLVFNWSPGSFSIIMKHILVVLVGLALHSIPICTFRNAGFAFVSVFCSMVSMVSMPLPGDNWLDKSIMENNKDTHIDSLTAFIKIPFPCNFAWKCSGNGRLNHGIYGWWNGVCALCVLCVVYIQYIPLI